MSHPAVALPGASPSPFGVAPVQHPLGSSLAVLQDDRVIPLAKLLGASAPHDFEEALSSWHALIDDVTATLAATPTPAAGYSADEVVFLPPTVRRPSVWCAGANYHDHVAEMGAHIDRARSFHFLSPPSVLSGHGARVERPAGATQLDWEIDLAAVIAREARGVAASDAVSYVAGYSIANDVSVRDATFLRHPLFGIDWTSSKNADTLTPIGPALTPARFVADPGRLTLQLSANGEVRQDSDTSLMIVALADQIAALSQLVTLQPGDVILTGTPAGTAGGHDGAYLRDGDEMIASISGLGTLRNRIA